MPARRAPAAAATDAPPANAESTDAYRRRPRQSRGQRRVELLLDAAAAVIAEHGLEAATAEAIAAQARTAKGSLYQFFPNRDAVLAALALRYADEMRAIHERAFPIDPHGLPLERLIDRVVKPLAEFHDRNPAFRRVFAINDGPVDDTRSAPACARSCSNRLSIGSTYCSPLATPVSAPVTGAARPSWPQPSGRPCSHAAPGPWPPTRSRSWTTCAASCSSTCSRCWNPWRRRKRGSGRRRRRVMDHSKPGTRTHDPKLISPAW